MSEYSTTRPERPRVQPVIVAAVAAVALLLLFLCIILYPKPKHIVDLPLVIARREGPVLTLPGDITWEADGPEGSIVTYYVEANDSFDGAIPVNCAPASGATFAITTTTVTCSASNSEGVSKEGSFKVTVRHTVPPELIVPGDATLEARNPSGVAATFAVTVKDSVDQATWTCDPPSNSTFPIGQTTVSCTAIDEYENQATASFRLTVVHTLQPPKVPTDMKLEATGPGGAVASFSVLPPDDPVDKATATCDHPSGSTFPITETLVTCTATDERKNRSVASFKVTVVHTKPPQVKVPGNMTLPATGPDGAVARFTVSAIDPIDKATATCDHPSGSTFPITETLVTCTATDVRNNSSSPATFKVNVIHTLPPPKVPADIELDATGPAGAVAPFSVSPPNDPVDKATVTCDPAPGATFPIGQTVVTCTATDERNNQSVGRFKVKVAHTLPPPVVPADMTVEATTPSGGVATFSVAAPSDPVDVATVNCDHSSGSAFPLGETTVTCTASDERKNKSTSSFKVKVVHTLLPRPIVPSGITRSAPDLNGVVVDFEVSVNDPVDQATVTCDPPSGSIFKVRETTVTCTATDPSNNHSSASFIVKVTQTPTTTVTPQ